MAVLQQENTKLQKENHALRDELRELREFVDILNTLAVSAQGITSNEALMPLLRDVFTRCLKLLNAPEGSLLLLDDETHELKFVLVQGAIAERLLGYRIPADEGIAGWVIQNAKPTLVRDVRRDWRFSENIDDAFKFRTQSIAAAPLIGNGRVLGVLEALNQPVDEPFSDMDLTLLALACRFAGDVLATIEQAVPETDLK
jgi:GAF domain-containing protein